MRLPLGWVIVLLAGLLCAACSRRSDFAVAVDPPPAVAAKPAAAFRVIGCLPDYRLRNIDPATVHACTDLIYFSIEPKADGSLDLTRLSDAVVKRLHDLTASGSPRLYIALGGADRSANFAAMTRNRESRARFVQALTKLCTDDGFSGADFDWEQPETPDQVQSYTALLTETRASFAPLKLKVSVSLSPWTKFDPAGLADVDEVHVMAYDHDGEHSTLEAAKSDLDYFVKHGVPKLNLYLGLPFYGRNVRDPSLVLTYAEIVSQFHPKPDIDRIKDLYFNNVETIRAKADYARQAGFGGVMIWEIGQDTTDSTSLMHVVAQTAGR